MRKRSSLRRLPLIEGAADVQSRGAQVQVLPAAGVELMAPRVVHIRCRSLRVARYASVREPVDANSVELERRLGQQVVDANPELDLG